VPRGRHHDNSAQAADVGCQIGGALRQAGLCLFARAGRLSLSSWGATALSLYERGRWQSATALLDHSLSNLCALKSQCTPGPERRIARWEHEHLLETVQQRLDANPEAMRQRRETIEHPFGTMKARMGATNFLTKTLPKIAAEMALSVLAYNLTRVMNIVGIKPLMTAIAA
jgi:Transposase DDE domain